uniref:Uncharacterized protein n=1 Tax=Alexandrium monilatum TaxID=311494 RepID=A0A7S4UM97_9DINO|mmetsp:Transcript_105165/g.329319  ORF Transcript_105165/g.329319 Transcript_105165/m.329319 type:complete len:535 (+) Transcript_105165:36-1640(+)
MEDVYWAACRAAEDFNTVVADAAALVVGEAPRHSLANGASSRSVKKDEPPLLDLRELFRPLVADPLPAQCRQSEELMRGVYAERAVMARNVSDLLFGDIDASPHARLVLRCEPGLKAHTRVDRLPASLPDTSQQPSLSSSLPHSIAFGGASWEPPAPQNSYADGWASAVLLRNRPGVTDFEVHAAIGSPANLPRLGVEGLSRTLQILAWLLAGDPAKLGGRLREVFPNTAEFFALFAKFEEVVVRVEQVDKRSEWLIIQAPLDLETIERHYNSIAFCVRHFDNLGITVRHPKTKAVLLTATYQQDCVTARFVFVDGQPAWLPAEGQKLAGAHANEDLVAWSSGGTFDVDMEIESQVRLLGLYMPATRFPNVTVRLRIESGAIHVTCSKVGEAPAEARDIDSLESVMANIESAAWAALEGAGSLLFDIPRFRQLMQEEFKLDLAHPRREEQADGWTIRAYLRFAVPSTQVADLFSKCVQDFITNQVSKMDLLSAMADLFQAVGRDAALLNGSEDPGATPGERRPSVPPASPDVFL